MHISTLCTQEPHLPENIRPTQMPIFATSSFYFSDIEEGIDSFQGKNAQHFYSRYGNPGIEAVAQKIANLEVYDSELQAYGLLTSSGMSAISTLLMSLMRQGDAILTQSNLYGGTTELFLKVLEPTGIETVFCGDFTDLNAVEECLKKHPQIKLIYFETPANPTLSIIDMEAVAALAKKYNKITVADNTLATPYLQQPLKWGIDFVVHSTTKYLNGHGNGTAGVIIGTDQEAVLKKAWTVMKLAGTNASPFEAWLINTGLKTLELRMERHCSNALELARRMSQHEAVEKVNYPGLETHKGHDIARRQMNAFGGMISFELKGGLDAGIKMMNKVKICKLAPTLGDVESLILHPASMSHVSIPREVRLAAGITDGLVRLSVGIENIEDLWSDLF